MDQEIEGGVIDEQDLTEVGEPTVGENGEIDWTVEGPKFKGIAQRRTTALKKSKGYIETLKKPAENNAPVNNQPKKGELGYGEKAFLNSLGFKDVEDHKFVQDAIAQTGKSLEEVLASPFIKGELERMGEERVTKAAQAPQEGRNGAPARSEVDYWLKKGELPPENEPELRRKVVNAKMKAGTSGSNFSSNPVVGKA